jgi:hypothetical protein
MNLIQILSFQLLQNKAINQLHWLTDNKVLRSYMSQLGMSDDEDIFGSVVLGYPALSPQKPTARKDGRIIVIK